MRESKEAVLQINLRESVGNVKLLWHKAEHQGTIKQGQLWKVGVKAWTIVATFDLT